MDEAALRAMMPASFGRRGGNKARAVAPAPASAAAATTSGIETDGGKSGLSSTVLGKRPSHHRQEREEEEEGEDDDGLTPEERAANREAERKEQERRARGASSSDEDSDDDSDDDSDIGPPPPPPAATTTTASAIPSTSLPPTANTASFTDTHTKTVSALAVDASGSRFALGSYDFSLSLYDFGGMSSSLKPFRLFSPTDNYPVLDLDFNRSGSHLLVVCGTSQAKLFTRDGAEVGTCARGDPYLRDMRNTKGHVGSLTCGVYLEHGFCTGGEDGTVRVWREEAMARGQEAMIVLKSRERGGRTKVTAVQQEASDLWVSGEDGSLSMWDLRGNVKGKPRWGKERAHEAGSWTSSIALSDANVVTRGGDGTVKLWDRRALSSPVVERSGLPSGSIHTSVIFDPFASRSIVTPVAAGGGDGGNIVVLDTLTLDTVSRVESPHAVRLHWSLRTDQLYTTHRHGLDLLYDPARSTNGILLALGRARPTSVYADITPSSTDSYPVVEPEISQAAKRRRLAKARNDATATRLPQPPLAGRGVGGRIGAAATQHVVQSVWQGQTQREDPREALLRYAKDDEGEWDKAWRKTQPDKVYADVDEEGE